MKDSDGIAIADADDFAGEGGGGDMKRKQAKQNCQNVRHGAAVVRWEAQRSADAAAWQ